MSQMNEMQEKMRQQLAQQTFTATAGDGSVRVSCDGTRRLTDVSIDPAKMNGGDPEEIEDLLLVAVNDVLSQAAAYEADQAGGMMKDMLPPGLSGMFG